MKVDISINTNKSGIELRFDEKPAPDTTSQLKAVGFKYSYRQNMWYAVKTDSTTQFANNLKAALESGETTIAVKIKPSYAASEENITKKNFSYVTIALKEKEGDLSWENYIVFEPSRNVAQQIASEFAKEKFGEALSSVKIYPRNYLRKARQLFKEGKIIDGKEEQKETTLKERKPSVPPERPLSKKDKLEILDAFGNFARKRQADFGNLQEEEMPLLFSGWLRVNHQDLTERKNEIWEEHDTTENILDPEETIEIPFSKTAGYEGSIRIRSIPGKGFSYGNSSGKQFGDYAGSSSPSTPESDKDIFPTRDKALKAAFERHVETLASRIQGEDYILDNEEKKLKRLRRALDELIAFVKTQGVVITEIPSVAPKAKEATIDFITPAAWKVEDEEYPQNKVMVFGMVYNQSRLRDILLDRIGILAMENQLQLISDASKNFKERRPIQLEKPSQATLSKAAEKKHKAIIRSYLDDMILDNALWKVPGHTPGIFEYLTRYLLDKSTPEKKKTDSKKKVNKHDLNQQIEEFINEKGDEDYSVEDKQFIAGYTGSGGLIKQGAKGKGVLYEYFTPDAIIEKMWGLAYKYGYKGGAVLEPSCGTGNFFKYAPREAEITGYEINPYSARIAQLLYPKASIYQKPFEGIFFAGNTHLKDDFGPSRYELVIGNPPYGEFSGKWAGMGEKKWIGAGQYDHYFIIRGLDLLLPEGLLVFIVPSAFLKNKYSKVKEKIAERAQLLDAYRLPERVFKTTDIGTDIIVFKRKINEP